MLNQSIADALSKVRIKVGDALLNVDKKRMIAESAEKPAVAKAYDDAAQLLAAVLGEVDSMIKRAEKAD